MTALPLLFQFDLTSLESPEHTVRQEIRLVVVSMCVAKAPSVTTAKANIQVSEGNGLIKGNTGDLLAEIQRAYKGMGIKILICLLSLCGLAGMKAK